MEDDANKPHALFRSRLLHLLDKRGLSQAALARDSGIVQQTLHAWTKAKGAPGPDDLCSLARALGVSVDYLVGFADSAEEAPADSWIVDEEFVEAVRRGDASSLRVGDGAAVPVPRKMRVLSSVDYQKLRAELAPLLDAMKKKGRKGK